MKIEKIFKNSLLSGLIAAVILVIIVVALFCLSFFCFLFNLANSPYIDLIGLFINLVIVVSIFIPGILGVCFQQFREKEINPKTGVLSGLFTSLMTCTFVILILGLITILLYLIGAHATIQGFIIKGTIFMVITSICGAIAGALYGLVVDKWFK